MQNDPVLKVYCDGGARGNPGPSASAFVGFGAKGRLVHEGSRTLGTATNNVAEYTAVLEAVEWLTKNHRGAECIDFYLDSLLVVNQLNGEFKIKNENLLKIANQINGLVSDFPGPVTFQHIRREKNHHADFLVNKALDRLL